MTRRFMSVLTFALACAVVAPPAFAKERVPVLEEPDAGSARTARTVIRAGGDLGLRVVNSRHYRIHADLDATLVEDLAQRMDAMYDEYARRLATFKIETDVPPLEVYLFQKQRDYLRFTGDRLKNTGGVYMPGRNLLAAFLEGQGREAIRRTLQHEAFHQFAHNAISPELPVWLNEGMAQLFEEGIWTGGDFWLGQVPPRRIRQLQADLQGRRLTDFQTFLRMTNDQWGANLAKDHDAGATQYNQSWAMVYFLVHARDDAGREKYRPRLLRLLQLMHEGQPADVAWGDAFGKNTKGFQQRFVEFARGLGPTPEATIIENQGVLADLLSELHVAGERFETLADFRALAVRGRYRLNYTKGQLKWSTDPDLTKYFSDLDGRAFDERELYFEPRRFSPLPDIVCRWTDTVQFRTRFYEDADNGIEHEVLVESPGARASAED